MQSITRIIIALVCFIGFALGAPLPSNIEERASGTKGSMTWFKPGLGNCGKHNKSTDMVIALPTKDYAGGKHCNKYVMITANGHTVKAKVVDSCPTCSKGQLDVSPQVFKSFAKLGKGVQKITWKIST